MSYPYYIINLAERIFKDDSLGFCRDAAPFFMGYIESCAPQERSESNRVNYNITSKSGQPLAIGPGPRYGDVKVMPIRDKDKCN